jgi:hypothetical protein
MQWDQKGWLVGGALVVFALWLEILLKGEGALGLQASDLDDAAGSSLIVNVLPSQSLLRCRHVIESLIGTRWVPGEITEVRYEGEDGQLGMFQLLLQRSIHIRICLVVVLQRQFRL